MKTQLQYLRRSNIWFYIIITITISLLSTNKSASQQWYALPDPLNGQVLAILSDTATNILYVGGSFSSTGSTQNSDIASWNGVNWNTVGTGMDFLGGSIFSLEIYNNNLIAAGDFTDFNSVAKWDGTSWSGLGNGFYGSSLMAFGNTTVCKIKSFDNKLYITGGFRYILPFPLTDTINSICYWDNVQFQKFTNATGNKIGLSFHNSISGFAGFSMTVHNNAVYVGGQLDTIAGNPIPSFIGKLDSTGWVNVGQNTPPLGFPYSLFSYNGELYAGGQGPAGHLHKLSGNTWIPFGQFLGNPEINAMCSYKGDLVVAGRFDSVDNVPAKGIARWNGTNWNSFGNGIDGEIWCLEVFQGDLYAGGNFVTAGGISAPYIARWSEPTGIDEAYTEKLIKIYPNPTLTFLNVEIDSAIKIKKLLVFNTLGKSVKIFNNTDSYFIGDLPKGSYAVQITIEDGKVLTQKIIIQ